jgi:hypothetical protein
MKLIIVLFLLSLISCGKNIETKTVVERIEDNTPVNTVELIDPCGDKPGVLDEILLRDESTGQLLAYFEDSTHRFLAVIEDGNYITGDAQACRFTVLDGEIVY